MMTRCIRRLLVTLLALRRHARAAAVRLCRILPVAAFLLVAASTDRADASCGDWLAGHEAMPGRHQATDQGGGPAAPCDGPLCRRDRGDAPAVPPAPTRQLDQSERWCRLAEELASRPDLSSRIASEAEPSPLTGFRLSIERPPRG